VNPSLVVRPNEAADRDALPAAFTRLSPESRLRRVGIDHGVASDQLELVAPDDETTSGGW
jgi:hypothetical protein